MYRYDIFMTGTLANQKGLTTMTHIGPRSLIQSIILIGVLAVLALRERAKL